MDQSATRQSPPHAAPWRAGLYFVATPIGAARDITLRALDILASADVLAAEDTRTLRHLMEIHGVALGDRPLVAYHDHNDDSGAPAPAARAGRGQIGGLCLRGGHAAGRRPRVSTGPRGDCRGAMPVLAAPGASAVLCGADRLGPAQRPVPVRRLSPAGKPAREARSLRELAHGAGDADPLRIAQTR